MRISDWSSDVCSSDLSCPVMSLRLISLLIPSLVGRLDTYPFRRVTQHSGPAAEYERLVRRDFVSQYRINAKKVGGFLKGLDPLSRHQRSEHRQRAADCPHKGGVGRYAKGIGIAAMCRALLHFRHPMHCQEVGQP